MYESSKGYAFGNIYNIVAIILSLFIGVGVVTAFLVVIGVFLVLYGYFSGNDNKK